MIQIVNNFPEKYRITSYEYLLEKLDKGTSTKLFCDDFCLKENDFIFSTNSLVENISGENGFYGKVNNSFKKLTAEDFSELPKNKKEISSVLIVINDTIKIIDEILIKTGALGLITIHNLIVNNTIKMPKTITIYGVQILLSFLNQSYSNLIIPDFVYMTKTYLERIHTNGRNSDYVCKSK